MTRVGLSGSDLWRWTAAVGDGAVAGEGAPGGG